MSPSTWLFPDSLPLLTIGDECLCVLEEACVSEFAFKGGGLPLPAETGLFWGNVVLRFGGVSRGKPGGTTGCGGGRSRERGPGELGRLGIAAVIVVGGGDEVEWRRVGVQGCEFESDRAGEDGECKLEGPQVAVDDDDDDGDDDDGLVLSADGRVGVEDLVTDVERRVMGEDDLLTVLGMEEDLFE